MKYSIVWAYLALSLYFSFITFPLLNLGAVFQVSEAREGVVVNEILQNGEVILPLRNGELVPSKPILFHWIGALGELLTGRYSEFELRFPSALAALGCVLIIFSLGNKVGNIATGVICSLVLSSTYGFYHLAFDGRVDMVFCFFVTLAICFWIGLIADYKLEGKGVVELKPNVYWKLGVICGFAVLAKGPLGVVAPFMVIAVLAFMEAGVSGVRSILRLGWLAADFISVPWYIAAAIKGGSSFIGRQVIFENLQRLTGGEGITAKPFWFYLVQFWSQAAPWSLLILLLFIVIITKPFRKRSLSFFQLNKIIPDNIAARFCWKAAIIWLLTMLFFFSCATGKRRGYLLPVLPAVSLIIGLSIAALPIRVSDTFKHFRLIWKSGLILNILIVIFCGLITILPLFSFFFAKWDHTSELLLALEALKQILLADGFKLLVYMLFFTLSSSLFFCRFLKNKAKLDLFLGSHLLIQLIFVVFLNLGFAIKGITHSYKFFVDEIAAIIPIDSVPFFVKRRSDESFDGFFFYFKRHVRLQDPKITPEAPGLYLARRNWLDQQPKIWLERIEEIKVGGRKTDSPDEQLVLFKLL